MPAQEYTVDTKDDKVHVKRYKVPFVHVGPSLAVPGEKGLFADRDLHPGMRIGVFEGVPVGVVTGSTAMLDIPGLGRVNVDGRTAGPPFLAMINDAHGSPFVNNAVIKADGSVSALRDIPKGSEILMDYGTVMPAPFRK